MRLDDRVALVTGASGGLGAHFAGVLAKSGARVAVGARRLAELEAVAGAIGERAMAVPLDVTDDASVDAAVAAVEARFGPVDVLVNNAGVIEEGRVPLELAPDAFAAVLDTNLVGAYRMARRVGRRLIADGRPGAIVNVASILSFGLQPGVPAYCAAKAGLAHLTKQLALDLAPRDIRVNALAPGYIETDISRDFLQSERGQAMVEAIPSGRVARPEDLDGALLLLASDAGASITGVVLPVDAGHLVKGL
ncbi:MAG: glucose 1-dehydrogenase [Pseudomonadota bacterium]